MLDNKHTRAASKELTIRFGRCRNRWRFQRPSVGLLMTLVSAASMSSVGCDAAGQSQSKQPAASSRSTEPATEPGLEPADKNRVVDVVDQAAAPTAKENAAAEKPREGGHVLEFNGIDSYIDVGHIPFDSFAEFTIEAWVKDWQQRIVYQGKEGDPENSVWLTWGSHGWSIGWESVNGQNYSYKIDREPSGEWEHVALVFDGENQFVFADGKLVRETTAPKPGPMREQRRFLVGAQEKWKPSQFEETQRHGFGYLSILRISSKARYTEPFTPPEQFVADKQTELLYDMSRLDEKTLDDLSQKKRHGQLHEVKWISRADIDEDRNR